MFKFDRNRKSQITDHDARESKLRFWSFGIGILLIVCNLVLGAGNLKPSFAEDKIVAIVNNEAVTRKDVDDFLHFMSMQLSREFKGKELEAKIDSLKTDLLNRLIEDRLILQEAKKEKLPVEEARVKAKINEIKKRYRSDDDFQKELMGQGLTQADIENKIRDQFLMYGIIEQKVRSKVNIKPEEITSFYEANKKDFSSGETREFESYALENADLADSFAYNLKLGKTPEDLATRYPFTMNSFSVLAGESLKKEIEEAVFKLGINEVSSVVSMDDKYYVFKLINIIPARTLSLNEVQYKIQTFLFEKRMQEDLVKWIDELKKRSYIKIN